MQSDLNVILPEIILSLYAMLALLGAKLDLTPKEKGMKGAIARAEELLAESLSAWRSAMRPGAALGLSWNLKTLPRQVVVELLEAERFTVVQHPMSFEHVVDRSITRDLIVARR